MFLYGIKPLSILQGTHLSVQLLNVTGASAKVGGDSLLLGTTGCFELPIESCFRQKGVGKTSHS
jgi:hypothetical protein